MVRITRITRIPRIAAGSASSGGCGGGGCGCGGAEFVDFERFVGVVGGGVIAPVDRRLLFVAHRWRWRRFAPRHPVDGARRLDDGDDHQDDYAADDAVQTDAGQTRVPRFRTGSLQRVTGRCICNLTNEIEI